MNPLPRFYIDTTVAIDGILASPAARDFIRTHIEGNACASSFVWIEYNRTLVADCAILYNTAIEAVSIGDFSHRVENHWFLVKRPRRMQRCRNLRDSVLHDCERRDQSISIDEVRSQLRLYALRLLPHRLSSLCRKQNPDKSISFSCPLEEPPRILGNGRIELKMNCNKAKADCVLPEIFKNRQPAVADIFSFLNLLKTKNLLDQDQSKMLNILISSNKEAQIIFPRGQKACFALGDLTITLCCPDELPLLTTNVNHFAPLVVCINGTLLRLILSTPAIEKVDLSKWQHRRKS